MDLEANHQGLEKETKDNLENGEEYVGITESPHWKEGHVIMDCLFVFSHIKTCISMWIYIMWQEH